MEYGVSPHGYRVLCRHPQNSARANSSQWTEVSYPLSSLATRCLQDPLSLRSVSLPAVTTLGYMGQLAGPAMIGFIADAFSLSAALGFVGVLLLIVAFTYKEK